MRDMVSLDKKAAIPQRPAFARWLGTTNEVTRGFLATGHIPDLVNLAGGLPAPEIYPAEELAELARGAVAKHPAETLGYGPVEGLPELRDALASRFSTGELRLRRENVLVTSSGMQGLDLIGKALIDEGALVAAQFPTYLGALDAWRPRRPIYRHMALERAGFDPTAALAGAQFAYTVPNFSNPTGRLVGLEMREALVAAAAMIEALTLAKQGSDMCTSGVTQRIALAAIEIGLIERLQPRIVALYRERRDALCKALAEHLGRWFEWELPVGGMFVWAIARDAGLDTDRLLTAALAAGVCVAPSSVFDSSGRNRRAIRLNFTLNPPERLAEGVRRLAGVLQSQSSG